ncbi:MAG TPA: DUF2760 domain-containing protein [Terrimicrobiaceae bacterium]|nr:DUF2760 domain-containing protein [Terrimicrobiaceae bacterium]
MKSILPIAAVLLAVLNSLLLIPALNAYIFAIAVVALVLAVLVALLSFSGIRRQAAVAPSEPVAAKPPPPAANQAEAEIVAFVGLLQDKGRLVDFLMEDVNSYDDTQVGAAARVVHQGCRAVLNEHFKISPVSEAEEGSQITLPADYAADEYRLTGKISGNPPFKGTLLHKGWKADSVKLPRIVNTNENRLPSIAPAQVEVK